MHIYKDKLGVLYWADAITEKRWFCEHFTVWKVSKYGVFSGPYLPAFRLNMAYLSVFSPNAGKCAPEKASYFDTFQAVLIICKKPLMVLQMGELSWQVLLTIWNNEIFGIQDKLFFIM